MQVKYQARDGQLFDNADAARSYEARGCKHSKPSDFDQYLSTYSGKELLRKYPDLSVQGTWEIRGEDANCDMHGPHHMPHLATVEGTLQSAIEYGVKLPSFWQWGAGGDFREAKPVMKL